MSAPKTSKTPALKATTHRDSLAKTVRLLTNSGIDVQFRGHIPHVVSRGNKCLRLVLPELNDNAPPELLEALAGYLDHEVGHIYYTPFARAEAAAIIDGQRSRKAAQLLNIVEDIRLEKLLPRDLPGTKENLARMYEKAIPTYFGPSALEAKTCGDPNEAFSRVIVVAFRALSGQRPFQAFMDDNDLWPHIAPLVKKIPNLSRKLRELETYDDVIDLVEVLMEAMKPPPPPPPPPEKDEDEDEQALGDAKNGTNKSEPEDDDDAGDDESDPEADGDDADGDDPDEGNEGNGDGKGTDNGDEEDGGDCSGDADEDGEAGAPGDDADEGDDAGGDEEDDTSNRKGPAGADDDAQDEGDEEDGEELNRGDEETGEIHDGPTGDGDGKLTIAEALRQLEASQRRAIYLYNRRKQTVSQIAEDLSVTEDEAIDLLRNARRRLGQLMQGD